MTNTEKNTNNLYSEGDLLCVRREFTFLLDYPSEQYAHKIGKNSLLLLLDVKAYKNNRRCKQFLFLWNGTKVVTANMTLGQAQKLFNKR